MTDNKETPLPESDEKKQPNLTHRETDVLKLLCDDLTNRQVSEKLGLSIKTVLTHRSNIKKKLGIAGLAGMTKWAIKHGIIASIPLLFPLLF